MDVKIYKCFVASPSDTNQEREACDRVFHEINKTLGEQLYFRIESKKWENDSRPGFGEDAQTVITKQLLGNYQLFIGIMWNKFGTPTKRAESGTEEEFQHAYDRYVAQDDIEIMLYFNEAPVSSTSLDLEQVQKVRGFKEKVSKLGGLYSLYNGVNEFEEALKKHINDFFVQKLSSKSSNPVLIEESERLKEIALHESVSLVLENRLKDALCMFSNQPFVWVDPILSKTNEISQNADDNYNSKIDLNEIVKDPKSLIIKAPPQFGLTSLAHYLISNAWGNNDLWVYLDTKKAKRNAIEKSVEKELASLNLNGKEISCIILDSWLSGEHGVKKLLRNLSSSYKNIPIIVMQTIDDSSFKDHEPSVEINRKFETLHLLALPRNQIRKVVSDYNSEMNIGEEEVILEKVIKDLEVLNIHRTPLNCLTLLKVSESHFDESPVNRTKLLEMVLFVLFDLGDELPTYKVKPDLKDCEYVLGRFCENLILNDNYEFSRECFLNDLNTFCTEKLIYLEVSVVFDILFANNILMKSNSCFIFRASYWIYYFAAKRMYLSKEFCDFILNENKYVCFPEIIEFYTGIDRNRSDVLETLTKDISGTCDIVERKIGLPKELNPFRLTEWNPSKESLAQMQEEISGKVLDSKLPESLKDQYADRNYNQLKPYDQSIQTILHEYSLAILMRKIKACSRALRNSDYVDPDIKRKLLQEITRGWEQISKILFVLTPLLASNGYADFEGQGFTLADSFGETIEERINAIFLVNPVNVVRFFKDDLFSNKIGPLLYDRMNSEENELIRHHLALLLIFERPTGWKENLENYIISVSKNSFYLYDIVNILRARYRYDFASENELSEISYLLKMGFAKHEFGLSKPGLSNIKKISNKVLPKREVNE